MPDYGHEIEFGVFLTPAADRTSHVLELAQLAEVAGLELVAVQDHPYQDRHLDTWTLLSSIGARTSTIRLAPDVASLPLRPPVVLAKSAASLDLITGGRVELGLGAGAFWDAIVAAGGPRRSPGEAVDALIEAIAIIRGMWRGGSLSYAGKHYQVKGLHAGPMPAHDIPIWLGAYKPRMLTIAGQLADAWVPSIPYAMPDALTEMNAIIDQAATDAGRGPQAVRRIYNITGRFGRSAELLQGTPTAWAEQLAELALGEGMATFILGTDDADDLRRFAAEVAPAVRELVAAGRATERSADPVAATTQPEPIGPDSVELVGLGEAGDPGADLPVVPTRDDGTRLTGELSWDESRRPIGPRPANEYTPTQRAIPQHLIDVHDALRSELNQVRSVVDQVLEGQLTAGAARWVINTMTLRQNSWTLGAYCQSYCRIVTAHHTNEDRGIFPHLRRRCPPLAPVLDRLQSEHTVIHDVLQQLDEALVTLVENDGYGAAGRPAGHGRAAARGRPAHRHAAVPPRVRGARAGAPARRVRLLLTVARTTALQLSHGRSHVRPAR